MESLKSKRPNLVRWAFAALPLPRVCQVLPTSIVPRRLYGGAHLFLRDGLSLHQPLQP